MVSPKLSRGFLAIVPPDDVLDAVEDAVRGVALPDVARALERSTFHLTVRFLGNQVDFDKVEATMRGLELPGGRMQLGGAGAFPRARRGDVVWIGLREGDELLRELHATVDAACNPHRPANEPAPPFHAHLTVARCKESADVRQLVKALGERPVGPAWTAGELVLMQSHLGRGPAEYEEKSRFRLEA